MNPPVFSLENLYSAYVRCRRNKRRRRSALAFEIHAEENLINLQSDLVSRAYRPLPSVCFVTESPKLREIFAADFRDRIVHHLVVSYLEPFWERKFIHDSFACRVGKGTHAAVARLQRFMRKATLGGARKAFYLHLDIRSFFMSIDKQILFDMLIRKEKNPDIRWLLRVIIFNNPADSPVLKGRPHLFDQIPAHKSLFGTPAGKGLPIGNYTSQFFANVYLNALDQFVKHTLKSSWYIRYVDDMVLVSHDRRQLEDWKYRIGVFLENHLKLGFNAKAEKLAPVLNGCDFLGYIVRPACLLIRRRVVNNLKRRLDRFENRLVTSRNGRLVIRYDARQIDRLQSVLGSYMGHLDHGASFRLKTAVFRRYSFLFHYFVLQNGRLIRADKPPRFSRLSNQYRWFRKRHPDAFIFFQVGLFYEFYGRQAGAAKELFDLRTGPVRPRLGVRVGFPVSELDYYLDLALKNQEHVLVVRQTGRQSGALVERRATYKFSKGFSAVNRTH